MHYIEGGWPGANPKDDEFFQRAPTELDLDDRRRWWPSARPAGRRARSTTTRRCATWSKASTVDGLHRRQVLGLPRHRGAADHARRGRGHGRPTRSSSSRGARPAGVLRRRALLRRLQAQPRVHPAGARGGGRERAPTTLVLCDTNGGVAAPRGRADRAPRSSRHFGATCRSASTSTTTPAAAWPTRWPASAAAPPRCRARSTATASAPATATSRTIIPNLTLKMGVAHAPRGPARAAHPGRPPHRRAGQHRRSTRSSPTSGTSAFAHKAGLHVSAIARRPGRLRARRPRRRSATAPASSSPSWPGKSTLQLKAKELGLELDGTALGDVRRHAQARSSTRATTSRRPTARSSC